MTLETKCWERDWEIVCKTEHLRTLAARNCYPFAARVLLINNVSDYGTVCHWAQRAVANGSLTECVVVEEQAPQALESLGLTREALGAGYVYSSAELVGIHRCRTEFLLHFAGDAIPAAPCEWIPAALALFAQDSRVKVANLAWGEGAVEARAEASEEMPDWYLGPGFSDQCYLVRAADFRAPIYSESHPDSQRYPRYAGELFEKRLDAWLRNHDYLRATYKHGHYRHWRPP